MTEIDTETSAGLEPVAGASAADASSGTAPAPPDTGDATPQSDWRARLAGDDRSFLKRLSRFPDEAAFAKSYRALEQKLSAGEVVKALPRDATDEQKAAWRAQHNLPDSAAAYLDALALPGGLVLGEDDRPVAESFAAHALERNWSAAQFNDAVGWYYNHLDAQRAAQDEADFSFQQESSAVLREEWPGAEYKRNLTAVNNLLSTWPDDLATRMLAGRTSEGRRLGDDPHFVRQLAALARELNPATTLVPANAADRGASVESRIAELVSLSADRNSDYWSGAKAEALQQELRDLNTQMEKSGR